MKTYSDCLYRTIILAIALCVSASLPPAAFAADPEVQAAGPDANLTPSPGTPERKAVLDALREEVRRLHALDVVFVVRHLKVNAGWSWLHAQPQSPDGQQRYEDVSALLQIQDGVWKVVEFPCTEVDDPECLDGPNYFTGLLQRFPEVPAEILPFGSDDANYQEAEQ